MTAQRFKTQLSVAQARRILDHCADCFRRAGVLVRPLSASFAPTGFARILDTLVLDLSPELCQQSEPGLLREALVLLHALSSCPGYSFCSSFDLWNEVLTQASALPDVLPAVNNVQFPRVVLDWNVSRGAGVSRKDNKRLFETWVLALFTTPSDLRFSRTGQRLLGGLRSLRATTAGQSVECVVSIRFARVAHDTKAIVGAVIASASAIATAPPVQSELTWVGVYLTASSDVRYVRHGLVSLTNMQLLESLVTSLPEAIAFDFSLPLVHERQRGRSKAVVKQVPREPLTAFVTRAVGVTGTELVGRLTVLDLTYRVVAEWSVTALDFACLCTLLPYSRSLQTLRLSYSSEADLLWLVYAILHPLTRTTQWRTLHLEDQSYGRADWPQLDALGVPSSLFTALWSQLRPSSSSPSFRKASDQYHVRRTAKVGKDVLFLTPDKTKTFVQPVDGCDVELCDTTTALDELLQESGDPDLDNVAVVVAGVGLGWVHRRDLTQLTDTRYEGAPPSGITSLGLVGNSGQIPDTPRILAFFGTDLLHLSASFVFARAVSEVAQACPHLESLEMKQSYRYWTVTDATETPALCNLHSVRLALDELSCDACFEWLARLPRLTTVRLRYSARSRVGWTALDSHLAALSIAKAATLRFVTVIAVGISDAQKFSRLDRIVCSGRAKCALLSLVQRARHSGRGAPECANVLVQWGSDVVRQVFDFAGPSVAFRASDVEALDWYDYQWRRP